MRRPSFRTIFYVIIFLVMVMIFYFINHQLAIIPIIIVTIAYTTGLYLIIFNPLLDRIEDNSSKRYWEIRPDDDSHSRWKKLGNFLYSYSSLLFSNFLVSIFSIFFLYKLDSLSNSDSNSLVMFSLVIVISVRLLTYLNGDIAKKIGEGFRYAMLPFGLTLFLFDFLKSLINQAPYSFYPIYSFIKSNMLMTEVIVTSLIIITSLEPAFALFDKIKRYTSNHK
jgi:hypothetical protein